MGQVIKLRRRSIFFVQRTPSISIYMSFHFLAQLPSCCIAPAACVPCDRAACPSPVYGWCCSSVAEDGAGDLIDGTGCAPVAWGDAYSMPLPLMGFDAVRRKTGMSGQEKHSCSVSFSPSTRMSVVRRPLSPSLPVYSDCPWAVNPSSTPLRCRSTRTQ